MTDPHHGDFNVNGGLTLVPMPGYERMAADIKERIERNNGHGNKHKTPVDIATPRFKERSSGEPYVQLGKDHIGGHDCVVLTSGPGTYEMLMRMFILLSYLAGHRAGRITVVCGYFPLGRSDKDEGSIEFAMPPIIMKLMQAASKANNRQLDRLVSVDLHAPQVVMAADPGHITEVSLVRRLLAQSIEDARQINPKVVLDFPDDGAAKRVEGDFEKIEETLGIKLPVTYGAKRRSSSAKSEAKAKFGDTDAIRDAIVITIDDEIATGGTNINNAKLLKGDFHAAEVWAAVTHGVLCKNAPQRFATPDCPVDRVYITDTISVENRVELQPMVDANRLHVVSWVDDLASIIYFHHWDASIREIR